MNNYELRMENYEWRITNLRQASSFVVNYGEGAQGDVASPDLDEWTHEALSLPCFAEATRRHSRKVILNYKLNFGYK